MVFLSFSILGIMSWTRTLQSISLGIQGSLLSVTYKGRTKDILKILFLI